MSNVVEDLDLWGDNNKLVEDVYNTRDGILVKDYGNSDRCYIFFSSNNLFYPNTKDVFKKKIIEENRFEWLSMASSPNVVKVSGRQIFVRDIYKQWYVTGCDATYNTHEKLLERLKELTKGYKVVTVGSSAGGYMAMLAGAVLDAEICIDVAGQLSLKVVDDVFYRKRIGDESVMSPYYELEKVIKGSRCYFLYLYAAYNEGDVKSYNIIREYNNVKGYQFAQKNHAATMLDCNYRFIIDRSSAYLQKMYRKYEGKVINPVAFFFYTVPAYMWIPMMWREVINYMKRRIKH